ncbi:hypothetical protein Tco_1476806 [Tanacetum coccineum]
MMYDDEDGEVTKELYEDVNVNLGNVDTEMTNANQVHDIQKVDEPVQSSSVSSDFTSKLLNLENLSPADNEIASLMETSDTTPTPTPTTSETTTSLPALLDFAYVFKFNERVFNLEKDVLEIKQFDQYAQDLSSIPVIVDRYMDNKLGEAINKAILAPNLDCRQEAQDEKNYYIELVDTSMRALIKEEVNIQLPQILPQAVSNFATPVIEKNVTKSVEDAVLTRSSSQPTSTYEADASLSEFELSKILIDKMEKNKSYDKDDYKKKLYDALVESYNTDKDLFDSYGEVFSLKRSRDEDKDRDPSAGSDRGKKRRKSKEPSHTVEDSSMQQDQEFVTGDNDEQPADKEVTKADCSQVTHAEEPPTSFDELNDTSFDFSAFVINRLKILNLTQEILKLYTFKQGDFKRLRLQDIEDMLLLLVQQKLTNLIIDERYDLNVALRMYTERIVIQRRVEDLQLGVKFYQNKLNLIKPDIYRSNLRNKTAYTSHSKPHGIIYVDQFKRKRLMHDDELHKFSDGTLNVVRTALHDIAAGIRMEYLPMRKWSNLDKKRARVMV